MLLRVSGLPVQTRVMAPAHRSFAEASRDGSAQAAAFAVFGDGIAVIGNLGEHVQNVNRQIRADASGKSDQQKHPERAGHMGDDQPQKDGRRRAKPEQCLREKLDFFPMCSNIAGLLCFSWFHAKMIPLFFQLCNHIYPF